MNRIKEYIAGAFDRMIVDILAEKELREMEKELASRQDVIEEVDTVIKRLDGAINGERYKLGKLEDCYRKTLGVFHRKKAEIREQISDCSAKITECEEEKSRVLAAHGMADAEVYARFKSSAADLEMEVKQGVAEMDRAGIRGIFAVCRIDMNAFRMIKLARTRLNSVSDEDFEVLMPEIREMFEAEKAEIVGSDDLTAEEKENLLYEISYFKKTLGYEDRIRKIRRKM